MSIKETISKLQDIAGPGLTLHQGADEADICAVEKAYGIILPDDFKELYRFSDGFETVEDMFNIIPLAEIIEGKNYKEDPLYIAEYMIYSDMWYLEINPADCNDYHIIVDSNHNKLVLTNSFAKFIDRFLKGGVFEEGGLYNWGKEVEEQPIYATKLKTVGYLLMVFYYGMQYGIVSEGEVIDWADRIVMQEDNPEIFFMDLSLGHDKNGLISLLDKVYVPESSVAARAILGLLYYRLSVGEITFDEVINVMDKHVFWNLLTPFEMSHIDDFTDRIWMGGSVNDEVLKQNIMGFLGYYKEFEIANYKSWWSLSYNVQYRLSKEEDVSSTPTHHLPKREPRVKLWMLKALVYTLAVLSLIVIITTPKTPANDVHFSKFMSDLCQLSLLYFIFFVLYYVFKSVDWFIEKLVTGFRKAFRLTKN